MRGIELLQIASDVEGERMAARANELEEAILRAVVPIAQGEDARVFCTAMMMAASAVGRHAGLPPHMFAYLADMAAKINQDILDGIDPETRIRPN
jgi:hypothetical protein